VTHSHSLTHLTHCLLWYRNINRIRNSHICEHRNNTVLTPHTVLLQTIHLPNTQFNVPLMRGPSAIAQPLVFSNDHYIIFRDVLYVSECRWWLGKLQLLRHASYRHIVDLPHLDVSTVTMFLHQGNERLIRTSASKAATQRMRKNDPFRRGALVYCWTLR